MKLWVDDIAAPPDDEWVWATTPEQAVRLLANFEFDTVSLDYDCRHKAIIEEKEVELKCDTGFEIVAWFIVAVNSTEPRIKTVGIHSGNCIGRDTLKSILRGKVENLIMKRTKDATSPPVQTV